MKNLPFQDYELKAKVEERFGLTEILLLDTFFAMRCAENEMSAAFIERVNDKWLLYKVPATQCYHHFLPLLDEDERAKLDDVLEFAATMGGQEAMGGLT